MQFKHPEILYALLLLIIPIIVHLFQLRRFKKVAFTNVKFLQELTIQTRKSSQIKKWLILITRLLLFACLILAFAQPYLSNTDSFNSKNETVIYLDNSFSMQAKGTNGTLLNSAVQNLIENLDENETITLFTNDANFYNTSIKAIKNDLIQLSYSPNQLGYEAAILKGKKAFSKDDSSIKNLVLISDFQQKLNSKEFPLDKEITSKFIQLKPTNRNNISIDSVYISKATAENLELTVLIQNQGDPISTLPVSLFEGENLVAKNAVEINNESEAIFTIPADQKFNGRISIEDPNLQYDNELFFNFAKTSKIKVLAINEAKDDYLRKIYTNDEFEFNSYNFSELNYNLIDTQNLIILNEIKTIPVSLSTALSSFTSNGGTVLIIPSDDINLNSYNQLFNKNKLSGFQPLRPIEKRITSINFSHPLLYNVFNKQIRNFQYPRVNSFFPSDNISGNILSYEDNTPFLFQNNDTFIVTAPLNQDNSNFQNSPLIVPVFYNIGKQSLQIPQLYYNIGAENTIDIPTKLQQDDIITLSNDSNSVVPLQQTYPNKVTLKTNDYPNISGILDVKNKETILNQLSFNFNRTESQLRYMELSNLSDVKVYDNIAESLDDIKSASNVNELWKWFVIFALAFLLIEMSILKFLK